MFYPFMLSTLNYKFIRCINIIQNHVDNMKRSLTSQPYIHYSLHKRILNNKKHVFLTYIKTIYRIVVFLHKGFIPGKTDL